MYPSALHKLCKNRCWPKSLYNIDTCKRKQKQPSLLPAMYIWSVYGSRTEGAQALLFQPQTLNLLGPLSQRNPRSLKPQTLNPKPEAKGSDLMLPLGTAGLSLFLSRSLSLSLSLSLYVYREGLGFRFRLWGFRV